MCGIVAILGRRPTRAVPDPEQLLAAVRSAVAASLTDATTQLRDVDMALRGVPGMLAVASRPDVVAGIVAALDELDLAADAREAAIDDLTGDELEVANAELVGLRDAVWAIRKDRLQSIVEVLALAGREASVGELAGFASINAALSTIDRLEVRGRDSAGVHVFVWGHDIAPAALTELLQQRGSDPLFRAGAVVAAGESLSFVYKAAAEIGELGDNTAALRAQISGDDLLRRAMASADAEVAVLGHTRWASVGIISEPNAHPVNSVEAEQAGGTQPPYVVAALNGDVDNHADLRVEHGLRIPAAITTDAKVIPTIVARHLDDGASLVEAFRRTVARFEGSVAIGVASAAEPGTVCLALNGSGQGLYVGVAEDRYVVASEPYGVVEETSEYVRMDGESGGEIVVLRSASAGELTAIERSSYGGAQRPVSSEDLTAAEVTTRDIDRGDHPHFLLKEITESPLSFAKTLRGRIVERDGLLHPNIGERALPPTIAAGLAAGSFRAIKVIGQGTAAVAGQSTAALLDELFMGAIDVDAVTATELSGFGMRLDMSDTLAIAISQSGTTTDTNRTVDLLRARGASVLSIVNRRASDLSEKADGVLFTSDGRDVEMSVASTKAFYAQVAAGALLACAIAEAAGVSTAEKRSNLLDALRELPAAMTTVLDRRPAIAEAAQRLAPSRRYWAVVGNGPNKVAAEEVRIKLSELCYKSIACDSTEDKKHIDLSSEPLILVCAAGLVGSTADDVAKEVAIFAAHKATPIVIASDGESRYNAAAVIEVPAVPPALGFILSSMAGHLFGYEAALAIDASAHPLRHIRERIEQLAGEGRTGDSLLSELRTELRRSADEFADGLRAGRYDGHLEASTATRLAMRLADVLSERAIERFQTESGKVGSPTALIDDLLAALTAAIDELTRPVDTIKHQAKTVTVGISRNDEGVLDRQLVQAVLDAGAGRDVLSYRTLKVLADLDPAVKEVRGYTRYAIDGRTVNVIDRGGISRDLPSRVDADPTLRGTKHRVAAEREVLVATGRRDGRAVIFVPEVKNGETTGISLLHVAFEDRLPAEVMRDVLRGYDRRYDRLVDWVSETEGTFDDELLGQLPVRDLLIGPISTTADHWRGR